MENDLFAETAPPPQTVKVTEEYPENRQFLTFNDQILSAFNSIQPRIDSLEKSLKLTEKNSLGPVFDTSSKINSTLLDLHASMPSIHDKSIQLSRRIQNISLKAQESTTIAAPKRLRPIIEDFCSLKTEFNQSLKHISIITEKLNQKIEKLNVLIKRATKESKSLKSLKFDLEKSISSNKRNSQIIDELKVRVIDQSRNERSELINHFEQSLIEAENLVKELEDLAEEGLNSSNKTLVKLVNEKLDIQSSFDSLSSEIDNLMNNRIIEIRSKIAKNTEKNDIFSQKIDAHLSNSLDKIIDDATRSPALTLLDQVEQKQEIEELQELLDRIDDLKKKIINHEFDPPSKIEQMISQNFNKITGEINNEDSDEEDYNENYLKTVTAEIDGKKRKISCFKNGTFEIQDD